MHFRKIMMIFSCRYFKLIISKFKVTVTLTFANENHKK